jgi:hypothetical protein
MINPGDVLRTSYGTGPFYIMHVIRDCTCVEFVESINGGNTPSKPHVHLTGRQLDNKHGDFYLGGYDEETLQSVWDDEDHLIRCDELRGKYAGKEVPTEGQLTFAL